MSTSPRKNLKIPGHDFAHLERCAGEDGDPSATAYVRKLIARDRIARARAEAAAFLAEVHERHPVTAGQDGPAEYLAAAVRLHELMTGTAPAIPADARPLGAVRIVIAQIAARALVDGAEHERLTGDEAAVNAFIAALASDPRVTLDAMRQATGALGNLITALIDLLAERALVEAAQ